MTADLRPMPVMVAMPVRGWAVVLAAALTWSYAPNLVELAARWRHETDYNHGFFVIPIALFIAWRRRDEILRASTAGSVWGWAALVAVLASRAGFFALGERWSESATLPAAVAALTLAILGPKATWKALPAIAFLALMLPMPARLNTFLAGPLQGLATLGATAVLQATGLPAISEGNIILVGKSTLEVARACNGLSMLLSFVTLVSAEALLARNRTTGERITLIASAAPIALFCNIARIAATAWAYRLLGTEAGEAIAHDVAGWAMMPLALFLGWLEIRILGLLFVEIAPADPRRRVVGLPIEGPRPQLALEVVTRLAKIPGQQLALESPRSRISLDVVRPQANDPTPPMIEGSEPSEQQSGS